MPDEIPIVKRVRPRCVLCGSEEVIHRRDIGDGEPRYYCPVCRKPVNVTRRRDKWEGPLPECGARLPDLMCNLTHPYGGPPQWSCREGLEGKGCCMRAWGYMMSLPKPDIENVRVDDLIKQSDPKSKKAKS